MNAVYGAKDTKQMIEKDVELGRLLERIVKNGKRNGLHLDENLRKQIEVLLLFEQFKFVSTELSKINVILEKPSISEIKNKPGILKRYN